MKCLFDDRIKRCRSQKGELYEQRDGGARALAVVGPDARNQRLYDRQKCANAK